MANQQGSQRTVLYVEDEESDFYFMQNAFETAGFRDVLRRVGTGREAIHYFKGQDAYADRAQYPLPTVMLLDLNLPVISGFAVLEWVREQADLKDLPVVVFTSSARAEDKEKALALGATEYLEKPCSGLQFDTVVQLLRERWLSH